MTDSKKLDLILEYIVAREEVERLDKIYINFVNNDHYWSNEKEEFDKERDLTLRNWTEGLQQKKLIIEELKQNK